MIKYANIEGYNNLGEIQMFSHLYQFRERDKATPMIILIHAYECDTKVFKGYIFNSSQTYENIPLTDTEINQIEVYTGRILTEDFSLGRNTEKVEGVCVYDKLQQIDFKKFIVGTILEDLYEDFMSCSKNGKNSEV